MAMRGRGPRRRYSAGPSYPGASRGDENVPPDGFDAMGPGAASQRLFHFGAARPPLASASSSMYNRKPQLPTPKNSSGVRAVGKASARRSVARTSLAPPTKRLRKSSAEILLSKCVSVTPANLEGCPDESFLSLELEWDIYKTILVEELKCRVESCRQKEAIIYTLECDLSESIQESNGLEKTNAKSLELLKERDMEIKRLHSELEEAKINRMYQQDHVSRSSAEQEKDDVSRQVKFHTEVIASLATEQASIQLQLAASKENELLAQQNLDEIELLLSFETIVQKEVLAQTYASLVMGMKEEIHRLLESQLEQSKSCYRGRPKEQEMDNQVAASLISRNKEKEIRKTHAEEKNEILKKNEMLEISIEDFKDTVYSLEQRVYSLEEKVNASKEEAQQQRRQREKLEVELHNLRQQLLVAQSSRNVEISLKDGMADLVDSTRVLSYRNNELLCSQESQRICRKEASDKESVVAEQLNGEMALPHLSHEEYQPESSQFEHPSPAEQPELYSNGADSDQAPSESGEQVPPEALEPIIEVVEEEELPPVAPVQDRKPLDYALAPFDELKRLRTINHYEGQRTATDRRFWSIEQQDLYTSIYKSATIFEMKWIDWEYIRKVDQFAGIRERCAFLGLEQIITYACAWDTELIRQFYSTVHISTDKSSITWMSHGRKITTNKRAWEETFGIPSGVYTEIHSQFLLDDDDKRMLYTTADCKPGQISGLSPLTIIAKKIVSSTIYPRSGNAIDGHNWNLLFHIVKKHPFDIISLLFGEVDLIISGRNGTKDLLFYAPYIMGMIMRAFEYDGPRESRHNSYKPRPSYSYKQKRRNRCSCPPAPAAAAPFGPPPSALKPEIVVDLDADNHHQFDAAGHQPQGEAVHGQAEVTITQTDLQVVEDNHHQFDAAGHQPQGEAVHGQAEVTITQTDLQVVEDRLRPTRHSLANVSAQPAIVRPSPFGRFPWYQREK